MLLRKSLVVRYGFAWSGMSLYFEIKTAILEFNTTGLECTVVQYYTTLTGIPSRN